MPLAREGACPLCEGRESVLFHRDARREYLRCPACLLTFVPASGHLAREQEVERYRKHRNSPEHPGYRAFLGRIVTHLVPRLSPGAEGLDYGSGPGPTLSCLLEERGFRVALYDPFFASRRSVLQRTYDFVTCTETAEHFRRPHREFSRLDGLLRPNAILALMTRVLDCDEAFPRWFYIRDATHVGFYRPETLLWIARRFGWSLDRPEPDIALFRKPCGGAGENAPSPADAGEGTGTT